MISNLPEPTQAVFVALASVAVLSAFMCTASPSARRERWRKAARQAALPSLSILPFLLWSSSHVDVGMSLAHYPLLFGLISGIYTRSGSRRIATARTCLPGGLAANEGRRRDRSGCEEADR